MKDREKVIRRQVEATCGNEYHFYTEDVLHLLVIIDSLRASQKELVEAGEPITRARKGKVGNGVRKCLQASW